MAPKKTAVACAAAAAFALTGVGITPMPDADAATVISSGATLHTRGQAAGGLNGYPYNSNMWGNDPDGVVTDVKVVDYFASPGIPLLTPPMNASIADAAEKGLVLILTTDGKLVKYCVSQGCAADEIIKKELLNNPDAPSPDRLVFIAYGSPYAENGIWNKPSILAKILGVSFLKELPDSPYDQLYVTREGDYFGDRPDRLTPLSVLNMIAGFWTHAKPGQEDIFNPNNLYKTVGNRTYVIIPQRLALLEPAFVAAEFVDGVFRITLATDIVKAVERILKPIVMANYNREGYAPLGTYVPPTEEDPLQEVSSVPDLVSLQGESPAGSQSRLMSLDIPSDDSIPPATSGGVEEVTLPPVTEEVVVDEVVEEVQAPVVTPEPESTPVVVTPEPVVEQKPEPEPVKKLEPASNDKKDEGAQDNDGKDEGVSVKDDTKDEKKVELRKKPGSTLKESAVRSHRVSASLNDDKSDKDDKSSAPASNASSPSSNSNSGSNSEGGDK